MTQATIDHPQSGEVETLRPMSGEEHALATEQQRDPRPGRLVVRDDANPAGSTAALVESIRTIATDPNLDVGKLTQVMDLLERMEARQAKMAFDAAMAEMQEELPVITERGRIEGESKRTNSRISQSYARWEDINDAIKPILARHGFALSFRTGDNGDRRIVTAILSHRAGHREETTMSLPLDTSGSKNNVQAVGSSTSYGKRYTASALLNITSRGEDDDGRAGGVVPIDEEQVEELRRLINRHGAIEEKVAAFAGVDTLEEIPANEFERVMTALRTWIRQNGGADDKSKPPAQVSGGREGDSNDLSGPGANVRTSQPDRSAVTQGGGQRKPSPAPSTEDSAVETAADLAGGVASRSASTAPGEPNAPHAPSFSGADAANIREALAAQLNAKNPEAAEEAFFALLDKLGRPRGRLGEALAEVRKLYLRFEGDEIVLPQLNALVDALIDGKTDA